jgi:hypothetical protein
VTHNKRMLRSRTTAAAVKRQIAILLVSVGTLVSAQAQTSQSDSLALVRLFNSTGGASWTNSANWLEGPVTSWYGVLVSENRVIELSLRDNELVGYIPVELGDLSGLRHLDLYDNQLDGPLPVELANLPRLGYLNLGRNRLVGQIPVQLGWLPDLAVLFLQRNQLSGVVPSTLGDLSKLRSLSLSSNRIPGEIPGELGKLDLLVHLYLYNNQLSGPIPSELTGMHRLETLDLRWNDLSGEFPPELGNLHHLKFLDLHRNLFTGGIPTTFGNLVRLEHLDVSENPLAGTLPEELVQLSSLERFDYWATELCAPNTESFDSWLRSVAVVFRSSVWCTGVSKEEELTLPPTFRLEGSFPNPFKSRTTIRYSLPTRAVVSLILYDALGAVVRSHERRNG